MLLVVLGSWGGGGGGVPVEDRVPPMILEPIPKFLKVLSSSVFEPRPPPCIPFPVNLCVSQSPPYGQEGFSVVDSMPSTSGEPEVEGIEATTENPSCP